MQFLASSSSTTTTTTTAAAAAAAAATTTTTTFASSIRCPECHGEGCNFCADKPEYQGQSDAQGRGVEMAEARRGEGAGPGVFGAGVLKCKEFEGRHPQGADKSAGLLPQSWENLANPIPILIFS